MIFETSYLRTLIFELWSMRLHIWDLTSDLFLWNIVLQNSLMIVGRGDIRFEHYKNVSTLLAQRFQISNFPTSLFLIESSVMFSQNYFSSKMFFNFFFFTLNSSQWTNQFGSCTNLGAAFSREIRKYSRPSERLITTCLCLAD